ncbi:MAG: phosphate-starvation-inducible PsiE family protein [Pseudomonadota bacterium]
MQERTGGEGGAAAGGGEAGPAPATARPGLTDGLLRYETFEMVVSAVLLVGMSGVILLATLSFLVALWPFMTLAGAIFDYATFQTLFDRALAALIAIELAHSVLQSVRGHHGLVQVRTVVIIGVLAIVRKFVLLDVEVASGMLLLGLAAALAALGVVYAVTHWIEDRVRARALDDTRRTFGSTGAVDETALETEARRLAADRLHNA